MTKKQAQQMDLELREQAASLEEERQALKDQHFFINNETGTQASASYCSNQANRANCGACRFCSVL